MVPSTGNVAHFANSQEAFLYHLITTDTRFQEKDVPIDLLPIQATLNRDLTHLNLAQQPVRGLITAGTFYDRTMDYCGSWESARLFREGIQNVLEAFPKVTPSIIWGRRFSDMNRALSLLYSMASDTAHLWAGQHIQTLKDLQQTFRIIRIAPGDTLELPDNTQIHGPADLSVATKKS